jgi:hypothetical protein
MTRPPTEAASIQHRAVGAPLSGKIPARPACNDEQRDNNSNYFHSCIERSIFNVRGAMITVHCHRNLHCCGRRDPDRPGVPLQLKSEIVGSSVGAAPARSASLRRCLAKGQGKKTCQDDANRDAQLNFSLRERIK